MSYETFNNSAAPATPASGKTTVFVGTDKRPKTIDDGGVISTLVDNELFNRVINGGFLFAQRQVPGTLTTYSNTSGRTYGADRWGMTNENASMQFQRIDTAGAAETGLQSQYYGKFKKITAAGKMVISQVIEGKDATQLRGRSVRVQARMKFTIAASMTVRLGLAQLTSAGTIDTIPATFISAFGAAGTDPTLGTNLSYIAPKAGVSADGGTVNGNAIDCVLSANWARFGGVFDVPTGAKNLVVLIWTNGQPAANDELNISEVTLSDGMEVQDWTPIHYSLEFTRAQRFYQKTFNVDTAPVQNAGVNTGEFRFIAGAAGALTERSNSYFFAVPMRIAPATVTLFNPAAANAQVRDITGAVDTTASAAAGTTERGLYVTATGNAATAVGNHLGIHLTMDAEL